MPAEEKKPFIHVYKQKHLPAEEKKTFIHVYKQRHLPAEEKKTSQHNYPVHRSYLDPGAYNVCTTYLLQSK